MITDPPILTLRRNFPRPEPELVEAFTGVPTGFVIDAMGGRGALDYRIKPVLPLTGIVTGVAVTSDNGPSDNLGLFASLDIAGPGDILVAATDAFMNAAITGDLLLGMARNRGVIGFVTDGVVRDLPGIEEVGLPVFAAGVTPNSPVRNGPGSAGLPVVLGGMQVASGDIIVADGDGVVVVPRERAGEVAERLKDVQAAEATLLAKVRAGLEIPDFIRSILDSDRTRTIS